MLLAERLLSERLLSEDLPVRDTPNVGTIGHVDHGKSHIAFSVTSALAINYAKGFEEDWGLGATKLHTEII